METRLVEKHQLLGTQRWLRSDEDAQLGLDVRPVSLACDGCLFCGAPAARMNRHPHRRASDSPPVRLYLDAVDDTRVGFRLQMLAQPNEIDSSGIIAASRLGLHISGLALQPQPSTDGRLADFEQHRRSGDVPLCLERYAPPLVAAGRSIGLPLLRSITPGIPAQLLDRINAESV
jgi:hypothetical protein